MEQLVTYAFSSCLVKITVAVSTWTDNPLLLNISFNKIQCFTKYMYFMPDTRLYLGDALDRMESSKETLPDVLFDELAAALKSKNIQNVKQVLSGLTDCIINGAYSADYRNQKLLDIMRVYAVYIKETRYKFQNDSTYDIHESFYGITGILQVEEWLFELTKDIFSFISSYDSRKSFEIINTIKSYICDNINCDISLESASKISGLSPGYMGKLFKNETGMNFPDYVNIQRLEKARQLLLNTSLSIAEITEKVGYGSPAYFIKRFKEVYGYTPSSYKKLHTSSGD